MSVCGGGNSIQNRWLLFSHSVRKRVGFGGILKSREREETVFVLGSVEVGDNLFTSVQPDYLEFLQQYSGLWLE